MPWCIPFFLDLLCISFSLVFPKKRYTPWLLLLAEQLCDLRVGRQTERGGVPRGGVVYIHVYTLFPLATWQHTSQRSPKHHCCHFQKHARPHEHVSAKSILGSFQPSDSTLGGGATVVSGTVTTATWAHSTPCWCLLCEAFVSLLCTS